MNLSIITYPNKLLTTPCKEVDINKISKYQQLFDDMIETVRVQGGLGLAANQVGVSKRILVYGNRVLVNPKLLAVIGKTTSYNEGCLSLPNERYDIKRFKTVIIDGFNRIGKQVRIKSRNKMESIVLQHEMDHLDGITIKDRKK